MGEVQEGREAITHNQLDFLQLLFCRQQVRCLLALLPPRCMLSGGFGLKLPSLLFVHTNLLQLLARFIVVTFVTKIRSERNQQRTRDQARTYSWSECTVIISEIKTPKHCKKKTPKPKKKKKKKKKKS